MNVKRLFASVAAAAIFAGAASVTNLLPDPLGLTANAVEYDDEGLFIENHILRSAKFDLEEVIVPEDVTRIAAGAFYRCKDITYVYISKNVTAISAGFSTCTKLDNIFVVSENTKFSSIDGVLFNKRETELIAYPMGRIGIEYSVPESVDKICSDAFAGCTFLTRIIIPEGVKSIDGFSGCINLTNVNVPKSVTEIVDGTFSGCTGLTSINVDPGNTEYTSVDGVLFNKDKTRLIQYPIAKTNTSYSIPEGVTEICADAFAGCTNLKSITVPSGVQIIGSRAFSGCTGLTKVFLKNSVNEIGDNAFSGCTSIISATVPGNPKLGEAVFERGVLLYGEKGSSVEKYVEDNRGKYYYNFAQIANIRGDVNDDGVIGLDDVIAILKHYVGSKPLSGDPLISADANDDGKVDLSDVIYALKLHVGS